MPALEEVFPNSGVIIPPGGRSDGWMIAGLGGPATLLALLGGADAKLVYDRRRLQVEAIPGEELAAQRAFHPLLYVSWRKVMARDRGARLLRVKGLRPGETRLLAKNRSGTASVDVSVKRRVVIRTTFNFVHDSTRPNIKTEIQPALLRSLLGDVNDILLPQANVMLVQHDLRTVDFPTVQPFYVQPSLRDSAGGDGDTWHTLVANRDGGAPLNVFIVKRIGVLEKYGNKRWGLPGLTVDKDIALSDDKKPGGHARTLAHESLHYLGIRASSHVRGDGVSLFGDGSGTRIPKSLVNAIKR